MGAHDVRLSLATALWLLSAILMLVGTLSGGSSLRWLAWGLHVGGPALAVTIWWIVEAQCQRNQVRVRELAAIMAAEAAAYYADDSDDSEVTPIR